MSVALGLLSRKVFYIWALWQERFSVLTCSGVSWENCKHETHWLRSATTSIPTAVSWQEHLLCHLCGNHLAVASSSLKAMHSFSQRKDYYWVVTVSGVKLTLSSPVKPPFVPARTKVRHMCALSEVVGYLRDHHWSHPAFVEGNGSIAFGMLTAADLGSTKDENWHFHLLGVFQLEFCFAEASHLSLLLKSELKGDWLLCVILSSICFTSSIFKVATSMV